MFGPGIKQLTGGDDQFAAFDQTSVQKDLRTLNCDVPLRQGLFNFCTNFSPIKLSSGSPCNLSRSYNIMAGKRAARGLSCLARGQQPSIVHPIWLAVEVSRCRVAEQCNHPISTHTAIGYLQLLVSRSNR